MAKLFKLLSMCAALYWGLSVSASILAPSYSNPAALVNEIAVKILKDCYADHKSIVVHGDSDESLIEAVVTLQTIAVIIHSDSSIRNIAIEHRTKSPLFLMTADSGEQLQRRLITFKDSPWWNIMTSFLVLDRSYKGCENARDILKRAWKMNPVASYFLCHDDSSQKSMIYTYNPYTNRAPHPWEQVNGDVKQDDGWTLYNRQYHEGTICDGWNFDRTKFLDGSKIKVIVDGSKVHSWTPGKEYDESVTEIMWPHDILVMKAIKYALNATVGINFDVNNYEYYDEPYGFFIRLLNTSSDIGICLLNPFSARNFTITYSVGYSEFTMVTQRRGYYSPSEKMWNYYGIVTLVSMLVILSITFAVILISEQGKRFAFAAFEILRLVVNTSLYSRMDTLPLRIFFSMIFLYFLIIQATFQGHLSSFLTKQEYRKNVESLEDLRDARYSRIYVLNSARQFVDDPLLERKIASPPNPFCTSQVLQNDSVACISDYLFITQLAIMHDLHRMKNNFGTNRAVYPTRNDWPLKERVDIVLMRLAQAGLTEKWFKEILEEILANHKRNLTRSEVHFRPISMAMLMFAFNIWVIGMTCATICFIFEIRMGEKRPLKKRRKRVKARH